MHTSEKGAYALRVDSPKILLKVSERFENDGYIRADPWHEGDWDVLWSLDNPHFGEQRITPESLRPEQLVNRFPLVPFFSKANLAQLPFGFIPQAFDLPKQSHEFAEAYRRHPEKRWVRKNRRHRGVYLSSPHEAESFLREAPEPIFVQEYVSPPHLICGRKWDFGVYVLLTSLDPLRLYVYDDIVLRFCPGNYPPDLEAADVGAYVISDNYTSPWDFAEFEPWCSERRFHRDMLSSYLAEREPGFTWDHLRSQCLGAVFDVVHSYAAEMFESCRSFPGGQSQFFELVRFDFLVDAQMRVRLMEANMSPNLSASHRPRLGDLFTRVVHDVFALVGISSGLETLRRKRLDPAFRDAWERANRENWIPVHEEASGSATHERESAGSRVESVAEVAPESSSDYERAESSPGPGSGSSSRYSLHGAVVEINIPTEESIAALEQSLPPGMALEANAEADVRYRIDADFNLFRGDELQLRAGSMDEALEALVSDLHFQIACHARTALFVHAGVVALEGTAILFPGRTFSGKSTMVAELVKAGAVYYSDEYAVLDREGMVRPYVKPISLRGREWHRPAAQRRIARRQVRLRSDRRRPHRMHKI